MLIRGIYSYEYIDSRERFDETSLPDKEAFYSSLNMEGITSVDYTYARRVYKESKIVILGDFHNANVQSDTLLFGDVFHFRKKCIEIYVLDPAKFLSAPGLAWQACLKKAEIK